MSLAQTGFRALPLPAAQLSLAAVLKCGQSFRWSIFPLTAAASISSPDDTAPTHEYRLCLRDRVVCLRQDNNTLWYRAAFPVAPTSSEEEGFREQETLRWIRDYFQLDVDLVKLYDDWAARDPVFARLRDRFSGIRMLRQNPWENLVSFICSSNNHIGRITQMCQGLCKAYSSPLLHLPPPEVEANTIAPGAASELEPYYPFPPPSALAVPDVAPTLRNLKFGYRADFIGRTASMLVEKHGSERAPGEALEPGEKWLLGLRAVDTETARAELLQFVGVGRKVADCVLLMSMDKGEVIPVDTHVYQIAVREYGLKGSVKHKANMTPKLYEDVNAKLSSVWGSYAGWAHSVLFTADLRSFATYGLPSPTPSPVKPGVSPKTPSSAATPPSKRKRGFKTLDLFEAETEGDMLPQLPPVGADDAGEVPVGIADTMAERVKRRRRGAAGPPA